MTDILIGSASSSHLYIEIFQYSYSPQDSEEPSDLNWLFCQASVSDGAWAGRRFSLSLQTTDFKPFLTDLIKLHRSLKGEAVFKTLEEQIEFKLIGNGRGKIEVAGYAASSHQPRCALHFNFDIDQTFLETIILQIQRVISQFPVR